MILKKASRACLLAVLSLAPLTAGAITQIGTRAGLGANDLISWASLGPEFTAVTGGATTGGRNFILTGSSAFALFSGSTYNSDFLPGDTVVSNFDLNSGPVSGGIRINFATPVRSAGAQIQISAFNVPFTGVLEAFGLGGVSMGSVSINSQVNALGNGSAAFIGLASSLTDIYSFEFRTGTDGFAINDVSVSFDANPIPEPGTVALVSLGVIAGVVARRRARKS